MTGTHSPKTPRGFTFTRRCRPRSRPPPSSLSTSPAGLPALADTQTPPEKTPAPVLASQFLANTLINRLDHGESANQQEDGAFQAMSNYRLRAWITQHRAASSVHPVRNARSVNTLVRVLISRNALSALAGRRVGIVTAVTALCVIAVSALPPLATLSALPADFRGSWLAANALILATVSQTAAALAGPLLGGGITMILYFAYEVTDNLAPSAAPYLGLTPYSKAVLPTLPDQPGPPAHWLLAFALILAALAVHGYTHGSTIWAQRRTNNEN